MRSLGVTGVAASLAVTRGHLRSLEWPRLLRSLAVTGVAASLAVTCGHWSGRVSCGHLRGVAASLAVTCGHWSGRVSCSHLRSLEWPRLLRSLAVTCGHSRSLEWPLEWPRLLRSLAVTCGHSRSFAVTRVAANDRVIQNQFLHVLRAQCKTYSVLLKSFLLLDIQPSSIWLT